MKRRVVTYDNGAPDWIERRGVPIVPALRRVTDVLAISWDGSISRSPRNLAWLPSFIG